MRPSTGECTRWYMLGLRYRVACTPSANGGRVLGGAEQRLDLVRAALDLVEAALARETPMELTRESAGETTIPARVLTGRAPSCRRRVKKC